MKKQPGKDAAAGADERIGFSFYAEDMTALRSLVGALRERSVRVKGLYLLRALAHIVPEDEIFAHGVTRNRQEKAGKAGATGEADQRPVANLLLADVDKLDRVSDTLANKAMKGGRSFLMRALVHAPWDLDALSRDLRKFQKEFPDPRTREGRALKLKRG
jgi:hypothetical protein